MRVDMSETKRVNKLISLSPEMLEQAKAAAKANDQALTPWIRAAIANALQKRRSN